jgi:high-affinity K+ transport system ATPase subunit B
MFVLLWGPTVAAVSVVLDHADAGAIVSTALGGLLHAARIAAFHRVDEVGLIIIMDPSAKICEVSGIACPFTLPLAACMAVFHLLR